jgi:protein-S-isoprenylcysteine O-methyltransferase Ste14
VLEARRVGEVLSVRGVPGVPRYAIAVNRSATASLGRQSILAFLSVQSFAAALLVTTGASIRMYAEEPLLMTMYPEYAAYRARSARVIPFVL